MSETCDVRRAFSKEDHAARDQAVTMGAMTSKHLYFLVSNAMRGVTLTEVMSCIERSLKQLNI